MKKRMIISLCSTTLVIMLYIVVDSNKQNISRITHNTGEGHDRLASIKLDNVDSLLSTMKNNFEDMQMVLESSYIEARDDVKSLRNRQFGSIVPDISHSNTLGIDGLVQDIKNDIRAATYNAKYQLNIDAQVSDLTSDLKSLNASSIGLNADDLIQK